ncbi:mediator of RNA polymerase II transcription subunit 31 [Neoconidiobolus thromboides FSU 785]|nr:mediator of RNA polymerase II transcription subunit 31 [Neoconidiobolus thromboides FSU 785]
MNAEELQIDQRFTAELEFISSLSNPWYINFLSQQDYFQEEEFINYLDYLLYWKQQPYCQYVNYPIAFYFLDLLQNRSFRESIHLQENVIFLHEKQYYHWLYNKRAKFIIQEMDEGKDIKESKEILE